MTALSTAEPIVNPRFTKLYDDRAQREQWTVFSRLVRIDVLNRGDRRTAHSVVRTAINGIEDEQKRQAELRQLPHARQFGALLGFYAQTLKLGHEALHISVKQIEFLTGVCRSNINFIHRWLHQVGWLATTPGVGLAIKHTCAQPHAADCRCRERVFNKPAARALTTLATKALRILHWVRSKVLLGCDVVGRAAKPVKDFVLPGLPERSRPGEKQRPKGGVSAIIARVQESMRFVVPKKVEKPIVRDLNDIDGKMAAKQAESDHRRRLCVRGRGGDVLAIMECMRTWPQYDSTWDDPGYFPPDKVAEARSRLRAQRNAKPPDPGEVPY